MIIIKLKNINKSYGVGASCTQVLKDLNLEINQGDMVAIMGPSGCGKSSLLNIIGCIDTSDSGEYTLDNEIINQKKLVKLADIRNKKISFIFQNFALIKDFTVLNNVILPLNFRKMKKKEKIELAKKYLDELGILSLSSKKVKNLSGGEQQRVAIARALIQETPIILADEPTGALDEENGLKIMNILEKLNKEYNKTIVIVTHNKIVSEYCNKVISLQKGNIIML